MRRRQGRFQGNGMRVVVIGSGLGGVTVAEELAKAGHAVTMVRSETHGYYARPRLSHGFAKPASPVLKSFAALASVEVLAGTTLERLDRKGHKVVLEGGRSLPYE